MNIEKLKQIEKDPEIKLKYLDLGIWGTNNLMYIPVILMVICAFWFLGYAFFLARAMPLKISIINIGISLGVGAVCFLWLRSLKRRIAKKNGKRIEEFPVCLARTVMGNDNARIYYCIYTTGEKRFDEDWLNRIYYKIWHVNEEPDPQLKKKINSLFRPITLAIAAQKSILLPTEFTEGEKVYKKIYSFSASKDAMLRANDDGFFPVICFNKVSVPCLKDEDYRD